MLFGKRNKKPDERVLELKARVDALRHADESRREAPRTLDNFLQGDDVLTGREVDDPYESLSPGSDPAGQDGAGPGQDVDLEAELEKYLLREQERECLGESGPKGSPTTTGATVPAAWPGASPWPTSPEPETPESNWSKEDWPPDDDWPGVREAS